MNKDKILSTGLAALMTGFLSTAVADGDAPVPVAREPDCATLVNPLGRVLVNQGDEYIIGADGMPVSIGDRIVTMDGSSVTVSYVTSATVQLPENSQLLIDQCDAAAAPLVADAGPAPIPVVAPTNYAPLAGLLAVPLLYAALDDDDDDDDDDDNGGRPVSPE